MSLYNMLHGFNMIAGVLLESLELYPESFGRFRDASLYNKGLETGQYLIRVITRIGGNNRSSYQEQMDRIRKHPYFLREEEDKFDATYLYFFFNTPPGIISNILSETRLHPILDQFVDNLTIKEKSVQAIATINKSRHEKEN